MTRQPIKPILTSRNMQKMIFRLRKKDFSSIFVAPVRLRLVSKIHKKIIEFFHKSVILTVAAKMGEKAFFLNLKIIFCIFLLVRIGLIS